MTDNEKAAVIYGMVRAFKTTEWPKHFNDEDIEYWCLCAGYAHQMLNGGAFNPFSVYQVKELFEAEFSEI